MTEQKSTGEIIMMGKRERVPGWKGELFVAIIKLHEGKEIKYQVVCDSTENDDVKDLPKSKFFSDKMEAFNYGMEMERNKTKWRHLAEEK